MSNFNAELENQLLSLLAKLERDGRGCGNQDQEKRPGFHFPQNNCNRWGLLAMFNEVRTLDLWRAVIGECLAAVFYVLLVCGSYSPWAGQPTLPERHLVISLVAGFAMTVLVHIFQQVGCISIRMYASCLLRSLLALLEVAKANTPSRQHCKHLRSSAKLCRSHLGYSLELHLQRSIPPSVA